MQSGSTVVDEVSAAALAHLEELVSAALARGDERGLAVIGYGEISAVLKLDTAAGPVAAKRLPVFESAARLRHYTDCLERYLAALRERGVRPLPTRVASLSRADGRLTAYCLQPLLPAAALGPRLLAAQAEPPALLDAVVDAVAATVDERLGLDAQLSNWAWLDGALVYLDVSTPLMRDERGREQLDAGLFIASLPWVLRPAVRQLMLRSITGTYYRRRSALCDLAANLYKEGLRPHLDRLLGRCNAVLEAEGSPPLVRAEVERYYRRDAELWAWLQRLRRADRWWQRTVRKRPYPFLLPGQIER